MLKVSVMVTDFFYFEDFNFEIYKRSIEHIEHVKHILLKKRFLV